jgi:hypothetical protein
MGVFEGAASKPPLGGAATQTRDSFCRTLSRAQRIKSQQWSLMRCVRL